MQIIANFLVIAELLQILRLQLLRKERAFLLEVDITEDVRGHHSYGPKRKAVYRYHLTEEDFQSDWFQEVFLTSTLFREDLMVPIAARQPNPHARSGVIHMTQADHWVCEHLDSGPLYPKTDNYAKARCYCPRRTFSDVTMSDGIPAAIVEWKLHAIHDDDDAAQCPCGMWMSRDKAVCGECRPCHLCADATRVHYLGGYPHCHTEHGESRAEWYGYDDDERV